MTTFGVLTPLSNTIHMRDQDGQEKFLGNQNTNEVAKMTTPPTEAARIKEPRSGTSRQLRIPF